MGRHIIDNFRALRPRALVISGATGLVGSELLRRLLRADRDSQITVLIRARGETSADARFEKLWEEFLESDAAFAADRARVRALECDLARSDLGLSADEYARLSRETTEIFHAAAEVRFDLPLEEARASNVAPTFNLLELAARCGNFRRFHHVSTYAVTRALTDGTFRNSYEQSKAEAETEVLKRVSSVPSTIYRVSIVTGDSRAGWTSKFDTFYIAFRLFLDGITRELEELRVSRHARLDAVGVDFVADALVALSRAELESGAILHIAAGESAPRVADVLKNGVAALTRAMAKRGRNLPNIPRITEVDDALDENSGLAAGPLASAVGLLLPYVNERAIYDDARVRALLDSLGVHARPVLTSLPALVEFGVRVDWGKLTEPRPPLPRFRPSVLEPIAVIRHATTTGGDIELDPARFRIPPLTAKTMDRVQKMVLLTADLALDGARVADPSRVGFVLGYGGSLVENDFYSGCRQAWNRIALALSDYDAFDRSRLPELEAIVAGAAAKTNEDTLANSLPNVAAGRVMSYFDFKGPSFVVNRDDASELAALEQASDLLRAGECDVALAGGVCAKLDPVTATAREKEGRDIPSENCSIYVLKLLSRALADGDQIESIIGKQSTGTTPAPTPLSPAPIAIVAQAAVLPGAETEDEFWRNALVGKPTISAFSEADWQGWKDAVYSPDLEADDKTYGELAAFAPLARLDARALRIPPVTLKKMDRAQKQFLDAATRALSKTRVNGARTTVLIGESKSGMSAAWLPVLRTAVEKLEGHVDAAVYEKLRRDLLEGIGEIDEDTRVSTVFALALERFCRANGLTNGYLAIDAACASSLAAMAAAVRELRLGRADAVVTGGVGVSVTPNYNVSFARCRALSATGSRPFDRTADGIVLGEGAVVFILKRLDDALADGDSPLAIIRGVGASSDGHGHSMMAPDVNGQKLALTRALEAAGCAPDTVQVVECHATGTRAGDETELRALSEVYRTAEREQPLVVGALKSLIGHTIGAAGAAGALKATLGLRHKTIAPTPLATSTHPDLAFDARKLELPTTRRHWPANANGEPRRAAVSAFGFGGTNWHLILDEPPLAQSQSARPPKLNSVFLFPGHGAPYPEMGYALYRSSRVFRATFEEANETLKPLLGRALEELIYSSYGATADGAAENLLRTDLVQPLILAADIAYYRVARDLGMSCELVLGHSVGEFAAAVAAEILSFDDALRAIHERGAIYRELQLAGQDTGAMVAVRASAETTREHLARFGARATWVANSNCPTQTVISGASNELHSIIAALGKAGLEARVLPISVAWHSPLAYDLGHERARAAFARLTPAPARVDLLSSATGAFYRRGETPGPAFIEGLVRQLGEPLNFTALIERAYRDGARRFTDIGPRGLLAGFVSSILGEREHRAIALDYPKQSAKTVLERARGLHA